MAECDGMKYAKCTKQVEKNEGRYNLLISELIFPLMNPRVRLREHQMQLHLSVYQTIEIILYFSTTQLLFYNLWR